MPTIKFTATPKLPNDYKHLGYVKGMEITDRQGWCDKWVNRGVAVFVDEALAAEPALDLLADPVLLPDVAPAADIAPLVVEAVAPVADAPMADVVDTVEPAVVPVEADKPRRGRPRAS